MNKTTDTEIKDDFNAQNAANGKATVKAFNKTDLFLFSAIGYVSLKNRKNMAAAV